MSSPHFYQADERFVEDVIGMKPVKEQHQTTIDIDPVGPSNWVLKETRHPNIKKNWSLLTKIFSQDVNMIHLCVSQYYLLIE